MRKQADRFCQEKKGLVIYLQRLRLIINLNGSFRQGLI